MSSPDFSDIKNPVDRVIARAAYIEEQEAAKDAVNDMLKEGASDAGGFSPKDAGDQKIVGIHVKPGEVFTAKDWEQLGALTDRLMPEGSVKALRKAKFDMQKATEDGAKDIAAREYVEAFGAIEDEDYEAVQALVDKAHKAKAAVIDGGRYSTLLAADDMGIIPDALDRIASEQRVSRSTAYRLARELQRHVHGVVNVVHARNQARLTDDEKVEAAKRWNKYREYEDAREDFKRRYSEAKSLREKAALREMFPEFAD